MDESDVWREKNKGMNGKTIRTNGGEKERETKGNK